MDKPVQPSTSRWKEHSERKQLRAIEDVSCGRYLGGLDIDLVSPVITVYKGASWKMKMRETVANRPSYNRRTRIPFADRALRKQELARCVFCAHYAFIRALQAIHSRSSGVARFVVVIKDGPQEKRISGKRGGARTRALWFTRRLAREGREGTNK